MSSKEHKEKIWNIIKDIKVGMLVTHAKEDLHARPMQLVQDVYDGTLWFYTDTHADKVAETMKDSHVCLTFACPDKEDYVSLTGTANLTRDKALIEKYWNPFVDAWFPKGKDSPNVGMIEVKVHAGEHWDSESSTLIQSYKMIKASITDEKPDLGENQKFGQVG